jgi:hypothetical protein
LFRIAALPPRYTLNNGLILQPEVVEGESWIEGAPLGALLCIVLVAAKARVANLSEFAPVGSARILSP